MSGSQRDEYEEPCDCSKCSKIEPRPRLPRRLILKHKQADIERASTASSSTIRARPLATSMSVDRAAALNLGVSGSSSLSAARRPSNAHRPSKRPRFKSPSPEIPTPTTNTRGSRSEVMDDDVEMEGEWGEMLAWAENSDGEGDDEAGFGREDSDGSEGGSAMRSDEIHRTGDSDEESIQYNDDHGNFGAEEYWDDERLVHSDDDEHPFTPTPEHAHSSSSDDDSNKPVDIAALMARFNIAAASSDEEDELIDDNLEPDGPETDEPVKELDLSTDPLRYTALDHTPGPEVQDEPDEDPEPAGDLPKAFSEPPEIRFHYIVAYTMHSFKGAKDDDIEFYLKTERDYLLIKSPELVEDLKHMAVTRRSMEARLGLYPDRFIIYWVLCAKCWRLHGTVRDLNDLPSAKCSREGCDGDVWTEVMLSEGRTKRVPVKVAPYSPLELYVRRLLLRPGKYDIISTSLQSPEDRTNDPDGLAPLAPPRNPLDAFASQSQPLQDIKNGWGIRTLAAGLQRREVSTAQSRWRVRDSPRASGNGFERTRRFISLPCGLVFMLNLDWFQPMKKSRNGLHSTGAIYITLVNNPEMIRFLPEEMHLAIVLPGPTEPTTEQLNELISPLVDEFVRLYEGIDVRVAGYAQKQPVNGTLYINTSDLPASRKASGMRGHTAETWMCSWCNMPMSSLTHSRCFDPSKFTLRDDWRYLKYAFRYRSTQDDDERKEIWERRGVQWSELNRIPGWLPSQRSPYDLLHGGFLAIVKHIVRVLMIKCGLMVGSRMDKFNQALASVVWPSSISRVPNKLENVSKGDHYRHLALILPILLYCAWQEDGEIPDQSPPLPRKPSNVAGELDRLQKLYNKRRQKDLVYLFSRGQASEADVTRAQTHPVSMDRNLSKHYENIAGVCVALRIWSSRSVSPEEVLRAEMYHSMACQRWARMHCILTPYCHLTQHALPQILCYGPQPSYWLFGHERANGKLAKIKTNGRAGGELRRGRPSPV